MLPFGYIREMRLSENPRAPLIVHIQDAHGMEEAQKNIAKTIEAVVRGWPLAVGNQQPRANNQQQVLVGLEGASGELDTALFREAAEPETVRRVADKFLKDGHIGGPEFAALTLPAPPRFLGIEDDALYEQNVQALRDSLSRREEAKTLLARMRAQAEGRKQTVYSAALNDFDRHQAAYRAGRETLSEYVRYLLNGPPKKSDSLSSWERARVRENVFPNLFLLLEALALEGTLDFKKVERERLRLVESLTQRLSQGQLADLT
jgi:hypothetical protein